MRKTLDFTERWRFLQVGLRGKAAVYLFFFSGWESVKLTERNYFTGLNLGATFEINKQRSKVNLILSERVKHCFLRWRNEENVALMFVALCVPGVFCIWWRSTAFSSITVMKNTWNARAQFRRVHANHTCRLRCEKIKMHVGAVRLQPNTSDYGELMGETAVTSTSRRPVSVAWWHVELQLQTRPLLR